MLTKGSDHARVHAPSAASTSKLMLSNSRRSYDEFIYIGIEIERVSTQIRYYIRLAIKLGLRITVHGRTSMKL